MNNFEEKDIVLYRFIRNSADLKWHQQVEERSGIDSNMLIYEDNFKQDGYVERPNFTKVIIHFNDVDIVKDPLLVVDNIFDLERNPAWILSTINGLKLNDIQLYDLNFNQIIDLDQVKNFVTDWELLLNKNSNIRNDTVQRVFNDHTINGLSYSELAKKYNISSRTAMKYVKEIRDMK